MKFIRTVSLFLLVVIFLCSLPVFVFGTEYHESTELSTIALPEDFNFSVENACSTEHFYFVQAAANKDGCFAVATPHLDQKDLSENTFKRQYIDLYHEDGSFWKELSFCTQFDYRIELTEKTINIYFSSYVVKYDLLNDNITCYAIDDIAAEENGSIKFLRQDEFTLDEWEYRCEKASFGFTKLIRSNGNSEEVLVNLSGQGTHFHFTVFCGVAAVGISLLMICFIRKRKK